MALRGEGGIDPIFFGNGLNGDVDISTAIDFVVDNYALTSPYRTVNFEKANGGDPDFTVLAYNVRILATRKIHVGIGVTLSAKGRNGSMGAANVGGTGGAAWGGGFYAGFGGGGAGGDASDVGGGSSSSDTVIGGRGGNGGNAPGFVGGTAGAATDEDLGGTEHDWLSLFMGCAHVGSGFAHFVGGTGGGGGGAAATSEGGGAGAAGGIILLAAPEIVIDSGATLTAAGGNGASGSGNGGGAGAAGGGGGGGGAIILIYGKLTMNGTLVATGGDGGPILTTNAGGHGGHGGHIYYFGGTDDAIYRYTSSDGADGVMATLAELAIEIALSYDGVRERGGNNRGPDVEMFQKSIGLAAGDPWCAAFVCFCIKAAAKQLGVKPEFQYGGSVFKLWSRNSGLQMSEPTSNCLFLIDHGLSKAGTRIGHTGFCVAINPSHSETLETMEGNTNRAGSRDGDGAYHKSREMAEMAHGYGYLRIA